MGEHAGAAGFTVGQRKGLNVALGEPRYVSRIDPATNAIVLGRREDLETRVIPLDGGTFVAGDPPAGRDADGAWRPFRAEVRIRHRAPLVGGDGPPGDAARTGARRPLARSRPTTPVWAIAPGPGLRPVRRRPVPRRGPDRVARGRRRRPRPPRPSSPGRSHDHRARPAARAARRPRQHRHLRADPRRRRAAGCPSPTSPPRSARGPAPRSAAGSASTSSRSATSR